MRGVELYITLCQGEMKKIRMIKENDLFDWKVGDVFEVNNRGFVMIPITERWGKGRTAIFQSFTPADYFIKEGCAEWVNDREEIGVMPEGFQVFKGSYYGLTPGVDEERHHEHIMVVDSPFDDDESMPYFEATLRLMKIVKDCNEGEEMYFSNVNCSYLCAEVTYTRYGGVEVRNIDVDEGAAPPWNCFLEYDDAEWSAREHKDMWLTFFKGIE